jgi:hypothetical protein
MHTKEIHTRCSTRSECVCIRTAARDRPSLTPSQRSQLFFPLQHCSLNSTKAFIPFVNLDKSACSPSELGRKVVVKRDIRDGAIDSEELIEDEEENAK